MKEKDVDRNVSTAAPRPNFEGIFKENSGTSENEEWISSSDEDEKAAVTDTIIGKKAD